MKKLLKVLLCCVCTLLVFALAIAPALFTIKASYDAGPNKSDVIGFTLPSQVLGVETDGDSIPLKVPSTTVETESVFTPDSELLDTAVKNLLSIGAFKNTIKLPIVVKPPVKDEPEDEPDVDDKNDNNDNDVTDTPDNDIDDVVLTDEYAILKQPDGSDFIYYEQTWDAYSSYPYGRDTVGGYGCGPTSMAMVISNLTGKRVSPTYMADWSVEHGYYVRGRGTAYGLFPAASKAFGIECDQISKDNKEAIVEALKDGKFLITVVRKGDFTNGRHFLLIRGITEDGKLLVGDSGKYENSLVEWDYDRLIRQVALGEFWVFGR